MENAKCYAPQILVGTEGLPREQWLEYRRKGIGGSDAAAVLGISPFRTGRDLYYDKLNSPVLRIERGTGLFPFLAILSNTFDALYAGRPFVFRGIGR